MKQLLEQQKEIIEKAEKILQQGQMTHLQINLDMLEDVNLTTNEGEKVTPKELIKMFFERGFLPYRQQSSGSPNPPVTVTQGVKQVELVGLMADLINVSKKIAEEVSKQ